MSARHKILLQYALPQHALTRFAGWVARQRAGVFTSRLIAWFVRKYGVDMSEAAEPDLTQYACFNDFFTRALKPGVRPLANAALVCPVDGAISQCGKIERDRIFQAKGHDYSSAALLGDTLLAPVFDHGSFATLYLSPKDYHRIHMPCAGTLRRMIYVPGDLFSVNPTTARGVPNLFARNERVVCLFDATFGPFALVLVGATIVGSMATVWHGLIERKRGEQRKIETWCYQPGQVVLDQGAEMGRFLLGSTVVMLFAPGAPQLNRAWVEGGPVRLGQAMAL